MRLFPRATCRVYNTYIYITSRILRNAHTDENCRRKNGHASKLTRHKNGDGLEFFLLLDLYKCAALGFKNAIKAV